MLAINALFQLEGLPVSAFDFLQMYNVVWPKRERHTKLFLGDHYLQLRNNKEPHTSLVLENTDKDVFLDDFIWISRN